MSNRRYGMLDLETYGLGGFATVVQIGFCEFDKDFNICNELDVHVDPKSCEKLGSITTQGTMQWWSTQGGGFKFNDNVVGINRALDLLFDRTKGVSTVYAKGSQLDIATIESYCQAQAMPLPWNYRSGSCMRTLLKLCQAMGYDPNVYPPTGATTHDALEDCIQQVQQLQNMDTFFKFMTGYSILEM